MKPLNLKTDVSGKLVNTVDLMGFARSRRDGTPCYYETIIMADDGGFLSARYTTREEAIQGHEDTVKALKNTSRLPVAHRSSS
jgi:hypothetical protein